MHDKTARDRSTPPSSVVVNTQGRGSGDSWFETCSDVWYPGRRPSGVAINTLVDLIDWLGKPQVFSLLQSICYFENWAAAPRTSQISEGGGIA